MKNSTIFLIGFTALGTTGCGTLLTDTYQNVAIETNPPGATCTVTRDGDPVNSLRDTPGLIHIAKSQYDLVVECRKPGYAPGVTVVPASMQGWLVGTVLVAGVAGAGFEAMNGAYMHYDQQVRVTLNPLPSAVEVYR